VGKLDEIHVPVTDLGLMRAFYEGELGFRVAFTHKGRMVALATGGAMLVLDATKPRAGPTYLGFQVKGTSELIARLQSGGVKVVTPTLEQHWGELLTCVEDPEGNVLAFEERTSRQGHHHHSSPRANPRGLSGPRGARLGT
jgi:predicted enzyme related to lactoylglutathione lyase